MFRVVVRLVLGEEEGKWHNFCTDQKTSDVAQDHSKDEIFGRKIVSTINGMSFIVQAFSLHGRSC